MKYAYLAMFIWKDPY